MLSTTEERLTPQNQLFCQFLDGRDSVDLSLMIDATNNCQLNCRYCYYGRKGSRLMDVGKVFTATKNLAAVFNGKMREVNFHYMGGEPLLAWDQILDLNERARNFFVENGVKFNWSMTSNLIRLDEEKTDRMVREKAGIHCSIDGPPRIHNRNRPYRNGSPSFDDVAKNVPLALCVSPNDTARTTICPEDAADLVEIAECLFGLGFKQVGLFPNFKANWDQQAIENWQKAMNQAFEVYKPNGHWPISTIVRPGIHKDCDWFNYCGAGKAMWSIGVDGDIFPCHHLNNRPEYRTINGAAASEVIKKAIQSLTLTPRQSPIPAQCHECPAIKFCNGGCWADNLLSKGDSNQPREVDCQLRIATINAVGTNVLDRPIISPSQDSPRACTYCDDRCDRCYSCERSY